MLSFHTFGTSWIVWEDRGNGMKNLSDTEFSYYFSGTFYFGLYVTGFADLRRKKDIGIFINSRFTSYEGD